MQPENFNQEVEQNNQVDQTSQLHQVTPLSKYLALALFIILPFLGGYIGYMYAPEKAVEVEVVRGVEVEKSTEIERDAVTDVVSIDREILDWAEFDIPPVVNPNTYNQIRWQYNGNIFSGLPAEKTYALFAIVDKNDDVVYSSIVGDGLSIDGSVNSATWGGDPVVGTVEDLYEKLDEGQEYRYKVTLGYAAEPGREQSFKDLAERHVSYSDWFVVNWENSVN